MWDASELTGVAQLNVLYAVVLIVVVVLDSVIGVIVVAAFPNVDVQRHLKHAPGRSQEEYTELNLYGDLHLQNRYELW